MPKNHSSKHFLRQTLPALTNYPSMSKQHNKSFLCQCIAEPDVRRMWMAGYPMNWSAEADVRRMWMAGYPMNWSAEADVRRMWMELVQLPHELVWRCDLV